ncbi:unnamed protein product [Ceratitis capitata]|uniref:(Mediterranean fruit fly) hypothetical protein n=1 Tax=Ceratitis capitata TaxID=7213 RepID=A0A811UWX1_CERCA|nr:unnamed protein product [Ceratitis capitata]
MHLIWYKFSFENNIQICVINSVYECSKTNLRNSNSTAITTKKRQISRQADRKGEQTDNETDRQKLMSNSEKLCVFFVKDCNDQSGAARSVQKFIEKNRHLQLHKH